MNYWAMTEQIPYTVYVATTRPKKSLVFGGQRYRFVALSQKKFFGSVEQKAGRRETFRISSREKTIVDCLAHPEYCGGMTEVIKAMWEAQRDLDWDALLGMARRTGIRVVLKRLGYLLDTLAIQRGIAMSIADGMTRYPYQQLDPAAGGKRRGYSREYGLILNRDRFELLGWMDS